MTRLCAALLLAALLTGCADADRYKIARPPLAPAPDPLTVFGKATLAPGGEPSAPLELPNIPAGPLTLENCLALAEKVNPGLDSADQARMGALWGRWSAITAFLPTAGMSYGATRYNEPGQGRPMDTAYSWQTKVTQPLFTGGQNISNYILARLGVAAADIQRVLARENLLLNVKETYFRILASEKSLAVARASVVNLRSHFNVAQNFYDVGMAPKNQVLEAEVNLAQAVQQANNLSRDLMYAKAEMNIFLRRPVEAPLEVVDNLRSEPFPLSLEQCLKMGLADRPELKLGRNQVEMAAKSVDKARSGLYPTVGMTYTNNSGGSTPRAHGGMYGYGDANWNVAAMASWDVWEWGRTKADIEQSKVALNQSVNALTELEDETKLTVTAKYQSLVSDGLNIAVAAKAVVSAAEDLRMVNERYLEQVATNTEVLDAQTRYSQAQYGYYTALYSYNLAWATLERSLGRAVRPAPVQPAV